MSYWQTLDVESLLNRRDEQTGTGAVGAGGGTTSSNVGAYTVPLGQPLRRKFPVTVSPYRTVTPSDIVDSEFEWALKMVW